MARRSWSKAVEDAVRRLVFRTKSVEFTRQELIDAELDAIIKETASAGSTPHQTLSRELQQMRDDGLIQLIGDGIYSRSGEIGKEATTQPSKGVFVVGSHSMYRDEPERFYRFGTQWFSNASRVSGNWIIYQEPRRAGKRGYYAAAKVDKIVPDPAEAGMFLAMIEPGTFLEFGQDVAFRWNGAAVESGLLYADGRLNNGRAIQSIRTISDSDFNRIVSMGLVDGDETLPREDAEEAALVSFREERMAWEGPVDRATMLVNRTVRDQQFRKRVLSVYGATCALTGMKLINGGGRAEAEAAHVMSVKAGGPDAVANGIALSGTVHWMFDRGLISLSDEGDILLSRKINDIESVERLVFRDKKAKLPEQQHLRPHPRYLQWHRSECFHG